MTMIVHFHEPVKAASRITGGKFRALARMAGHGFRVPKGVCIAATAYDRYVDETGLREKILMELNRKDFDRMRWEEMWDASLRIRNTFVNTPMPDDLSRALNAEIEKEFQNRPVTVRSSALGEDTVGTSFAGLHESFVNIQGVDAVLSCVLKVWASLWSDAALLYRRELGLDPAAASMAVVIQEMILGDCSGVAFGINPNDETQAVVEAVYGLNQGMVDGTIAPDRWILDRESGDIKDHVPAERNYRMAPSEKGVFKEALPPETASNPPLLPQQIRRVYDTVLASERLFGSPQDVEWTFSKGRLYVLQSRPITALKKNQSPDERRWYLTLRRSFDNLKSLQREIEETLIPQMKSETKGLSSLETDRLSHRELASEVSRRSKIYDRWVKTYWEQFIPFAHGARLFGQLYNDAVKPKDPHEFMVLLSDTKMESLKRNEALADLATDIRADSVLRENLASGKWQRLPEHFAEALEQFMARYHEAVCHGEPLSACREGLVPILLEWSSKPVSAKRRHQDLEGMRRNFLDRFMGHERKHASDLLELARSSYRLRDDDNIHLKRIEDQLDRVLTEARKRLRHLPPAKQTVLLKAVEEAQNSFGKKKTAPKSSKAESPGAHFTVKPRQLIGQPAGPGVASGPARLIENAGDLNDFKAGDVLVCDAVDPNMTYVVPLCAAIVERRGGMLIHGAIIAREYGIPCVTGVPDVMRWIKSGDPITVDGFLGMVVIGDS